MQCLVIDGRNLNGREAEVTCYENQSCKRALRVDISLFFLYLELGATMKLTGERIADSHLEDFVCKHAARTKDRG